MGKVLAREPSKGAEPRMKKPGNLNREKRKLREKEGQEELGAALHRLSLRMAKINPPALDLMRPRRFGSTAVNRPE